MSNLGIGVMLGMLTDSADSVAAFNAAIGKTISSAEMDGDALRLAFSDGSAISISDDGQSCCESRYMTTDDDLSSYAGAKLLGGAIEDGPDADSWGEHNTAFLRIQTSDGVLTCVTHVEHNGYYGGFRIRVCRVAR
jgi:hypothetical protein